MNQNKSQELTLLDYFATCARTSVRLSFEEFYALTDEQRQMIAQACYADARAMLSERAKKK